MRRTLPILAAIAFTAAVGLTTGAAAASATPPPAPANLRVFDGEEIWHTENDFRLDWDDPSLGTGVAAVQYRVRDPEGTVVTGSRIPWPASRVSHIHLPPRPGRYVAEVWFENALGEAGGMASAVLRFDDARPGPVEPLLTAGWVGGEMEPLLRLTHPAAPLPVSGIRGYAISVDQSPGGSPCAGQRCSDAETDLRDGVDGDTMRLERLPEGSVYVHAVAVSGSGMRSATAGATVVRVDATPPSVALHGAPAGWVDRAVTVTATATDARSGMAASNNAGAFTALAVDGDVPTVAGGSSVSAVVAGEGVHAVARYARDAAGNISDTRPLGLVRIDRSPPRVAFAPSLDPADPELLEARVADSLSGADPSRGSIAVRPAGSRRQFLPLPTVVSGGRLLARWDSDRFAPGTYEFRATGYDGAGNEASSQRRHNGTAMVLPAPLKAPTKLRAGFGGKRLTWHRCTRTERRRRCRREVVEAFERRPATRVVPYGRSVSVGGSLTAATGAPVAGVPVQITEVLDPGGGVQSRVRTVVTARDGSFLSRLPAGHSRQVEFVFAGTRTLAAAEGRVARLAVRAGVRLRASSATARIGGPAVVFSGAVEDAPAIPRGGKAVELQFQLPGLPWTQFRTVRTDASGHFRYPYRFSDDDSRGVRFQIRAFVPAEEEWPYEPAASRPVAVQGR